MDEKQTLKVPNQGLNHASRRIRSCLLKNVKGLITPMVFGPNREGLARILLNKCKGNEIYRIPGPALLQFRRD